MRNLGAIEAGGTKFICGVGAGPDDLKLVRVTTASPESTMAEVIGFFRREAPVGAIGIGSFGPIDRAGGRITSTPKAAWRGYEISRAVRIALGVPVGFDTDVNAAVLAEARWGAGRGLSDVIYLTVGTGIGGGALVNGQVLHGAAHAEMGHLRVPRDPVRDPFQGCCPYHGDCLEGLASGPALEARWGCPPDALPDDHAAWVLEAHYLALGVANLACTLSPRRVILGGGVMQRAKLLDRIRDELAHQLNAYVPAPDLVPPELGDRSGVLGALILAEQAL